MKAKLIAMIVILSGFGFAAGAETRCEAVVQAMKTVQTKYSALQYAKDYKTKKRSTKRDIDGEASIAISTQIENLRALSAEQCPSAWRGFVELALATAPYDKESGGASSIAEELAKNPNLSAVYESVLNGALDREAVCKRKLLKAMVTESQCMRSGKNDIICAQQNQPDKNFEGCVLPTQSGWKSLEGTFQTASHSCKCDFAALSKIEVN